VSDNADRLIIDKFLSRDILIDVDGGLRRAVKRQRERIIAIFSDLERIYALRSANCWNDHGKSRSTLLDDAVDRAIVQFRELYFGE
jgi:hypothetical protein